jgi:epsilon-lactone hydrolase
LQDDQAGSAFATASKGGDGVIHVPAFDLPVSAALSPAARLAQAKGRPADGPVIPRLRDIQSEADFKDAVLAFRHKLDEGLARPFSEAIHAAHPVAVEKATMGGVPVEIFTPADGGAPDQILINLHGGAFFSGATYIGRVESI